MLRTSTITTSEPRNCLTIPFGWFLSSFSSNIAFYVVDTDISHFFLKTLNNLQVIFGEHFMFIPMNFCLFGWHNSRFMVTFNVKVPYFPLRVSWKHVCGQFINRFSFRLYPQSFIKYLRNVSFKKRRSQSELCVCMRILRIWSQLETPAINASLRQFFQRFI